MKVRTQQARVCVCVSNGAPSQLPGGQALVSGTGPACEGAGGTYPRGPTTSAWRE